MGGYLPGSAICIRALGARRFGESLERQRGRLGGPRDAGGIRQSAPDALAGRRGRCRCFASNPPRHRNPRHRVAATDDISASDVHQDTVSRMLPELTRARPKKRYFNAHCMSLVDRRAQMRRDGAAAEEIALLIRELERECRRAKRNFLKRAITEEDWRGTRLVKPFQAAQSRIQNANGQIVASSQRSQVFAEFYRDVQFSQVELPPLPDRAAL